MIHFWKVSARITLALAATDGKTKKKGGFRRPPSYYRGTIILTAL